MFNFLKANIPRALAPAYTPSLCAVSECERDGVRHPHNYVLAERTVLPRISFLMESFFRQFHIASDMNKYALHVAPQFQAARFTELLLPGITSIKTTRHGNV